jgi:Skp family chaperone for outer membrane proteins
MRIVRMLLLAVSFMFAAGTPAMAQGGSVVVLNYQRVLAESAAGRDLGTKLNQIAEQMRAELQTETNWVQTEDQALRQLAQGQTQEQQARNTALQTRGRALTTRAEALRVQQVARERDLDYTRTHAVAELNRQLQPLVREVMTANRATVVISSDAVQWMDDSADITSDVISRLDRAVRTVNVTRMTAPAQPQQR